MQHMSRNHIQQFAEISADGKTIEIWTRARRLERWANLLEQYGNDMLNTLEGTEHHDASSRTAMRCDNSPFTVASADPMLRAAGLKGDTYGDIQRFFELTDGQLHSLVCHCQLGRHISRRDASTRVRALIPRPSRVSLFAQAIRNWVRQGRTGPRRESRSWHAGR